VPVNDVALIVTRKNLINRIGVHFGNPQEQIEALIF